MVRPINTQSGYAPVNGLDMYYEIHGTGRPLLMLHGGLSTTAMFFRVIPVLAQARQVIAVEQQGHGHTADIDRPLRYSQMADDTAALLRHLGLEQVDVFGYSAGGSVALQLALRHPTLVRTLVLASATFHPDGYKPGMVGNLQGAIPEGFPELMRDIYESVAPNPAGWDALLEKSAEQAANLEGLRPEEVQSLTAPALVLAADGDIIRPEHAEETARLLNAELVVLPNSDHASYMIESPEQLLTELTTFLDAPLP